MDREKDLSAKCIIEMEGNKTSITNVKVGEKPAVSEVNDSEINVFRLIFGLFVYQIPDGVTGDSVRERTKTFTYDFSYDSSDGKSASFVSQDKVSRY